MFRPLLSSVPNTTFCSGKAGSAHRSLISRNSSVTTSSNASSDQGTSVALDTEGSDHNQDDMTSEREKLPYSDIHEEVFAFDKIDVVNESTGREIHDESLDIHHGHCDGERKTECSSVDPEDSSLHGNIMEVSPTSETNVRDDFSAVDSLENIAVCSVCGSKYHFSSSEERDTKICPECCRKDELFSATTLETAVVAEASPVLSVNVPEKEKLLDDLKPVIAVPELPRVTAAGEQKNSPDKENIEEHKNSYSEQNHDSSQETVFARSVVEEGEDRHANQQGMGQLAVGSLPDNSDVGGQNLRHFSGYPNLKVDVSEGAGISLLLKRTSSIKGPVVQGRTFTASSIPYDDLSYVRGSSNSLRSSIGHGSFSASSSSIDFASGRQIESRVQRQLSGRKSDMENHRHDMNTKPPSTGLKAMDLSMCTYEDNDQISVGNMECDVSDETPTTSQERLLASECTEANVGNTSFARKSIVEDGDCDNKDSSRTVDASASELCHAIGIQLDDCTVASVPSYEGSASNENNSDLPNHASTDVEASTRTPESSFKEEDTIFNDSADGVDMEEIAPNRSLIAVSEIETENCHQSSHGSPSDRVSIASKSTIDEFLESSGRMLSDRDMIASLPESNTMDHAHGILGMVYLAL